MFWLLPSLPFVFCLGSGNAVSQSNSTSLVVNGVLGGSVILPVKLPTEVDVSIITWHYNGTAIVTIDLKREVKMVLNPRWGERLNFTQMYSLNLSNLMMADTGHYSIQFTTKTTTIVPSGYTLRIFRQLRNLKVINHVQLSENETCDIYLICAVENADDTSSFWWQDSRNICLNGTNFTTSWDPKNSSGQNYTCIAKNPVTKLSLSVSAQSLCEGVLTKENLYQGGTWIITTFVVAILIIILVCILVWRKRRDSFHVSSEQPQHPVQSLQNSANTLVSPGSTVYAQITHPRQEMEIPTLKKNDDSLTIYSIINHSRERKPFSPRATGLNDIK
ncbi:PREDICTED: SLAM family member 6 isoform X1 [Dipodomys ordii]|uniref:SLAM family member 6 isoform X1 n=1 Tax=Dipodomys ordii TaxID=10020 RepID=A0A1S3GBB5_DIPOR|nr:PREDICTED: SLAM family member 6 isoform X1 [Dipodomys ordii]